MSDVPFCFHNPPRKMLLFVFFPGVPPMVQDAKHVAVNPADTNAVSRWRDSNKAVNYFYSITYLIDGNLMKYFSF